MYAATVFLPLFGAAVAGLLGRWIGPRGAQGVSCGSMLLAAVLAVPMCYQVAGLGNPRDVDVFSWIHSGDLDIVWSLRFDQLSAVMVTMVTWVSAMIHLYSIGYMAHDRSIQRFFSYLSLFTFFMLMLVTSNNFVQMFFGWEGVGVASYLLIGFWYERPSAGAASIKAFVVNRVGDFGFALGIFAVFAVFGTVSFDPVFAAVPGFAGKMTTIFGHPIDYLTVICLLLFIGAMGKSAQLGLHTWLPDAMEGPTPVSALIHAATMVTAGVFMVCRLSPMFEYAPHALFVVALVGASTAIFAASVGMVQNDIKRVIAYSTCSQLGYMFFAAGVSAYPAAMFHLITHAFFKALLFLSAGSVIHSMSDEQDLRKMGGLWRLIPVTYTLMWIGSLALTGIPFFAGYFSKDAIIESAFAAQTSIGNYAFILGVAAAFLTAFYSWRLLYMAFHNKSRADHHTIEHVHESPKIMLVPMMVLAVGAILSGALLFTHFVGEGAAEFWGKAILILPGHDALEGSEHVPAWVKALPLVVGLTGIGLATYLYMMRTALPAKIATAFRGIYLFLLNKWYFDELYDTLFVKPAFRLGRGLWLGGDKGVIDAVGPDGIASATSGLSRGASKIQTGYVYHYAFAMLVGVVILVSWYLLRAGH
jgi:NADH-quinone oxidoreductase subunit L